MAPYAFTVWFCIVVLLAYVYRNDLDLSAAIPVVILLWPLVLAVLLVALGVIGITSLFERRFNRP